MEVNLTPDASSGDNRLVLSAKSMLMEELRVAIASLFLPLQEIPLQRSKDGLRVQYISPIALKLANIQQQSPMDIAARIAAYCQGENKSQSCLNQEYFTVEVVPPGIILFNLTDVGIAVWLQGFPLLIQEKMGKSNKEITSLCIDSDRYFPMQYSHARCCSILKLADRDRIIELADPAIKSDVGAKHSGDNLPLETSALCPNASPSQHSGDNLPLETSALCPNASPSQHSGDNLPLETSVLCPNASPSEGWKTLITPNPIPWLDSQNRLRLFQPAELGLISQIFTIIDYLAPLFQENWEHLVIGDQAGDWDKLAQALSDAFQTFYSQCRIWGEVKKETPKLAQARLGLVIATQALLQFILQELLGVFAPLEL